jgi:hypothetical protein
LLGRICERDLRIAASCITKSRQQACQCTMPAAIALPSTVLYLGAACSCSTQCELMSTVCTHGRGAWWWRRQRRWWGPACARACARATKHVRVCACAGSARSNTHSQVMHVADKVANAKSTEVWAS